MRVDSLFHAICFPESDDMNSCGCDKRDDKEDGMGNSPRRKRMRMEALTSIQQSVSNINYVIISINIKML